jgi:hypothetical protein
MSVKVIKSETTEYRILVKAGDEELARQAAVKAAISAEAARLLAIAAEDSEQVATEKADQTVEDAASALASKQDAESAATASEGFATASGEFATDSNAARLLSEAAKVIATQQATISTDKAGQSAASAAAAEAAKNLSVSAKDTAISKASEANSSSITATNQAGTSTAKAVESAQSAAQSLLSRNEAAAILANTLTGGAVAGQVPFWNGPKNLIGDAGFVWDNVNKRLGIGATPTQKLHVNGNIICSVLSLDDNINVGLYTPLNNISLGIFTNAVERARFTDVGLMIGSPSLPTQRLDVNGRIRVRLIDNAIGPFATYSATGVLQQRTRLEAARDILTSLPTYNAAIFQTLTHNASGEIAWT